MIKTVLKLRSAQIAVAMLTFIALITILGPLVAPYDSLTNTTHNLAAPSAAHWLGTDYLGRDVLSRILDGALLSVASTLLVAAIALVVGAIPGILSVYLKSIFEWISLRVVDTFIALPFLVFAVAMTALLGNGIVQAMIAVGLLVSPLFYRVARSATLSVANSHYVEAAILAGASTSWIVRKHVWSKVLPPIAISLATTLGVGLIVISSLQFLGIGVQPPTPTWGGILASDLGYLQQQPYAPIFPTALILITVLAFNLLADAIRDAAGESGRTLIGSKGAKITRKRRLARVGTASTAGTATDTAAAAHTPQDDREVVLELSNVTIHDDVADRELVKGVTFALRRGGVLGIVGESGSGKSLTCQAILGILPQHIEVSGGSIALLDHDVSELTAKQWTGLRGTNISAVFQDPASYLNPSIRVGKQVQEVLRVKEHLSRAESRRRTIELFEAVRLNDPEYVYQQYTHELSGGMLQRVLIASAIALEPDILIADEATTALDVTVQAEILNLLGELKARTGLSLIVVSHDLAVVAQLCDEVLVMKDGAVVEQGQTSDILYAPQHEYSQLLIAEHEQYGLERFLEVPEAEWKEEELDYA